MRGRNPIRQVRLVLPRYRAPMKHTLRQGIPDPNPVTIGPLFDFPKEPPCPGLNCLPPPSVSLPSG
ncbi:hypothetical protein EMIT0P74_100135 [Pseudomonas sp. IT-P74]